MSEKTYKACQSCATPFKHDPNPEKRDSEMYCSLCHQDGAFTYPDITLERMEEIVFEKVSEATTYPSFLIKQHVKTIKNLERWKKDAN